MAFKAVENANNSNGLMKEGKYEVTCKSAKFDVTPTDKEVISLDFVVRSDVEQQYKRKHIFKSFWKDDNGNWPVEKIGKYATSMGFEPGKEFELEEMEGCDCIVVIKHFTGSDGIERECIFYTEPTEHPVEVAKLEPINADDEDLPFN